MQVKGSNGALTRRQILRSGAALGTAAAFGFPAPAIAQGITGELAFATNEWTLPHSGKVLRMITESFVKKHPNVKVNEIAIPFAGFHDQILTQLAAGAPPDMFRIDDPQLALYMERGHLTPLDDALKEAGINRDDFVPAGVDARLNGQTLGIVYQTNARAMFWNKQILGAAGINDAPKTAAEFEAAIAKSTSREKGWFGYSFASKPGDVVGTFITLMPIVLGFGSHFTTPDGKPNATDPKVAEAMNLIKRMWDGNHCPRGLDGPSSLKLCTDGKVAMTINGSFVMGAAQPDVKPLLGVAPSPLPSGIAVRASSWYGVAAKGKNPAAAKAWLMHMLSPESQAIIADVERIVPALPKHIPDAVYADTPWFRTIVAGAGKSVSYVPPGLGQKGFAQVKTIADQIEAVLYRGTPVQTAMAALQKELETNLK
jgi:multiple sugar transport system substrate-binding protein